MADVSPRRVPRRTFLAAGVGAAVVLTLGALWVLDVGPFAPQPQADEVLGEMSEVDDAGGGGNAPRGGVVFAVPADALTHFFWEQTGEGAPPTLERLRHEAFLVPVTVVTAFGGTAGPVDDEGGFALRPVRGGDHLVCYASGTSEDHHRVRGCDRVNLRVPGRIIVTRGEAGLRVRMDED